MIKTIEIVVTPEGFTDREATRKRNHEQLREFMRQRAKLYEEDPSQGLRDLMAAGIMDENGNFTEPYKHLNQLKRKK